MYNKTGVLNSTSKIFVAVSPMNVVHVGISLRSFCKENDLSYHTLYSSFVNKKEVSRGCCEGWIVSDVLKFDNK